MLLTLTTTRAPATDLGFLLHKHPDRCQSFELSFGQAHVFYPEATDTTCTAALLLDVDPVGLVRGRKGGVDDNAPLQQYVNDRPYVASSYLSVALSRVYSAAMAGRSQSRPELALAPLPLIARVAVVACRGGEDLLQRLFEPLGYQIQATRHALDESFPEWGPSPYFTLELRSERPLSELLNHLYVLLPVLDDEKHYYVGDEEVEKLLRHGADWLPPHPARELIVNRYLKRQRRLTREALARLVEESVDPDAAEERHAQEEARLEEGLSLRDQRIADVIAALKQAGARRVLDLGCGDGRLLRSLLEEPAFEKVLGMDVSLRSLNIAAERLGLERMPEARRKRIELVQGSLTYRDRRLEGWDGAAVVEVIEHLDASRLSAFERALFEFARPSTIALTTPNSEYNVKFPGLPAGKFRHRDHRFEWTRAEFEAWSRSVAGRHGYQVEFRTVGNVDPLVGAPTQMGVFSRG